MLNLIDSFKLLKGLPIAEWKILKNEQDLTSIPLPYFMKISSNKVIHKTEQKAIVKCENQEQAEKSYTDFKKRFPKADIIIQKQEQGLEIIIGLKEDKTFGKILMVGFGGIFTEAIKDVAFRSVISPIDKKEIDKMLHELKLFEVFKSRKKYALDKLIDLIDKTQKLNVKELDLNPVILNEEKAIIVDSRIEN